jgi:hypothetical protein
MGNEGYSATLFEPQKGIVAAQNGEWRKAGEVTLRRRGGEVGLDENEEMEEAPNVGAAAAAARAWSR